ncbi:hypothetical protein PQO03_14300 [Lentisphaera profundi]|uniref:Uncharacterized protein n=1 Tax=Lentisphaera profundi TaxID=1658616 RepID=A0ABY7VXP6_9BACT|nr:hypothetical protein [Lentisphaera profundi]WDE99005.1 hypothetical protein PQO03_14300 [Lentisphaera profundi]
MAGKLDSLNDVIEPSKLFLLGSRAVMGAWGANDIQTFMWHDEKAMKWPILYADGHVTFRSYLKIFTVEPMTQNTYRYGHNQYTGEEPFYIKQLGM